MQRRGPILTLPVLLAVGGLTVAGCASDDQPADDDTTIDSVVANDVESGVATSDRVEEGGNLGFEGDEDG